MKKVDGFRFGINLCYLPLVLVGSSKGNETQQVQHNQATLVMIFMTMFYMKQC